ncbi:hypothetical protein FOZ62_030196, partial [Perkinsus olseni]
TFHRRGTRYRQERRRVPSHAIESPRVPRPPQPNGGEYIDRRGAGARDAGNAAQL